MNSALLIIDMQVEMLRRIEAGYDHVGPAVIPGIERLLTEYRKNRLPIIHVVHHDSDHESPFHVDSPFSAIIESLKPLSEEPVFIKKTSSAFSSASLKQYLEKKGIDSLVVAGAVAGFCVNTTVRDGCDLGYDMTVIRDAVLEFGFPSKGVSAQTALDVTLAYLEADFAKVVSMQEHLFTFQSDLQATSPLVE